MHMNSVPQHLLSEDRQEFERILDEALRSAPHRPELAAVGQRLNPEQLRTMALDATALITAAAATEYQHYVKVREQLRHPAPSAPSTAHDSGSPEPASDTTGLATTLAEDAETAETGAGAVAVIAVLAPVLAGTAAAIFLLVGYILKMLDPNQGFAQTMLTAGWVFSAVAAAAILVAAIALLLTALRNSASADAEAHDAASRQVARAREAWRDALLEYGILPFLRDALAQPDTAALHPTTPSAPTSRMPRLGYGRPGFSSPDDGSASGRPSFTSPDYTSPEFGGPEHQPD
ncbi:hypothetical protein J2Z21_003925 [Streptomyces griseochromogenes]|uniref:Transmembrane protein n=1 Tax=Streptomyces griseochromogenes TaxID=68214 RepID=A0A1B1BBI7_9ACTN|nr:hypothetical protein [Streptomyces griseochromogenes]ANP56151.1 hypothetical protein AVL59_46990 [Streptomyces griseochromogenes]MBP2050975.1 hypothetical protein [Streptomyces griseochromogenes]